MKRTYCSGCGSQNLDQFLDLGLSPIADAYTSTPDEVVPRYPLQLAVCDKCKLVQLLEVLSGAELFGTGYSFYSSASAPLSAYHRAYADDVLDSHGDLVRKGVLEVGCNDGDLLRHFTGFKHLGVDPSSGPATAAIERGCSVLGEPFSLSIADQIRAVDGPYGVVIANHVLAHVEDVSDVLAGISRLVDDGVAIIEVQYLPDLLVNNAFDLVYHEHRNFFSLSSLEHAAGRHGLFVLDTQLTDRQGGSLRVTLGRGGFMAQTGRVGKLRSSEQWLNDFSAYAGMQGRAERIRVRLLDLLADFPSPVAAYGAPAKLTTLLAFCGLDVATIRWVVDSTPAKQGRWMPGTGIPILSPTQRAPGGGGLAGTEANAYLLAAHNYARDIMRANPHNRWVVPFPAPVVFG